MTRIGPIHSCSLAASASISCRVSAPTSSRRPGTTSPLRRWAHPPTMRPSTQIVGPPLPLVSNSRGRCPPRQVAGLPAVELHLDGIEGLERLPGRGHGPSGPPLDVVARARPERAEPAPDELGAGAVDPQLGDAAREPALDGAPAELRADPGAPRPPSTDAPIEREVEEDLRRHADRALVRLPARQRDPPVEARIEDPELGGGRLATLANGGQANGLELLEVARRIRTDARLGQHPDRAPAFGLGDGARCGGVDHRHIGESQQEQRPAHRQQADHAWLLVHLVLERRRRRLGHPGACLEEHARRVRGVKGNDRCGRIGQGRRPGAGCEPVPDADARSALVVRDSGSRHRSRRTSRRGSLALVASVTSTRRKPAASNIDARPTYAKPASTRRPPASIG